MEQALYITSEGSGQTADAQLDQSLKLAHNGIVGDAVLTPLVKIST